jgi:predicted short-subunit dehydrogenase-like oxidoreductase (DUF2520 family)
MPAKAREKIVIIGCGNLAWHLAKKLSELGFPLFIYNHRPNPALKKFSGLPGVKVFAALENIVADAAFYFLCVPDKAIAGSSERLQIKDPSATILHTSGSAQLKDLGRRVNATAVMYPLQTFSHADDISWINVPILVEAKEEDTLKKVMKFAAGISAHVIPVTGKERMQVHLAAVFANNFSNALYTAATALIKEVKGAHGLSIKLLLPLIEQTSTKLQRMSPLEAQTGPAKRLDDDVIDTHIELLEGHRDLKKIYRQMTKLIQKQQKELNA